MGSQPHLARKSSSKGLRPVSGMTWKTPETRKQPVGHQRVQVGVEIQILAKGVNGHDDTGDAFGQAQARAQKLDQALVGDAAEVFEQIAVVAEVWAEHLGDAEHEMPVRHRIEDALGQQGPEELDLLLVAGRLQEKANRRSSLQ